MPRNAKAALAMLKAYSGVAVLAGMALFLLPSCSGQGKAGPKRYDPCAEMKTEGENLSKLDGQIEALTAERNAASRENDTAKVAALNAKLERKAELRLMNQAALRKASEKCDDEMRALGRYNEPPKPTSDYP